MRILIRGGQDVNEQTKIFRNTPLHIAAMYGHFLIVKFLLNTDGQQIGTMNATGHTAFDVANLSISIITQSLIGGSHHKPTKNPTGVLELISPKRNESGKVVGPAYMTADQMGNKLALCANTLQDA